MIMNHQSLTTTDFRYLNVFAPSHRVEIERGLAEMGTSPEVIFWVFTQLDDLKAEYTEQLLLRQVIQ